MALAGAIIVGAVALIAGSHLPPPPAEEDEPEPARAAAGG
jgi:hypothetical protein